MSRKQELHPELLSMSALNGLRRGVSSTRDTMFTGMLGQLVSIKEPERRRLRAGVEYHFGTATFKKEFKNDVVIIDIIEKYQAGNSWDSIRKNPLTLVVYQDYHTKEINVMEMHEFNSAHTDFGFRYKPTEAFKNLVIGQSVPAGTVLAHSPSLTDDGDYMYGVNANVAYMSHQAGNEDGALVCEDFLKKIIPTRYETRSYVFGAHSFGVNIYGNDLSYMIFPDSGSRVDSSGLLMAFRRYDEVNGIVNMTRRSLFSPDYIHDKLIYAVPNALIVDVKVERNDRYARGTACPVGTDEQLYKYYNADMVFHRRILEMLHREYKTQGRDLELGPELHRLAVQAIGHCHTNPEFRNSPFINLIRNNDVDKFYRNGKIEEWRVEITFEVDSVPDTGFKLSGVFGDKVVAVKKVPKDYMPVDANGNRADIVLNDAAISDRIIVAGQIEPYCNASARDTSRKIRRMLGTEEAPEAPPALTACQDIVSKTPKETLDRVIEYLLGWYKIASPFVYDALVEGGETVQQSHLAHVIQDGIYPDFPADNPVFVPDMISALRKHYRPEITPVSFTNQNGQYRETTRPVLIGSKYVIVLEKTGEDWSAVADPRRGHFGTIASITNNDKHSSAVRKQAVKVFSELDTLLVSAFAGGDALIDVVDAANSPIASKEIYRTILTAEDLSNIEEVVDRTKLPVGDHRPVQLTTHMMEISGKGFKRSPGRD